jgi:voltage-gated potassium channel
MLLHLFIRVLLGSNLISTNQFYPLEAPSLQSILDKSGMKRNLNGLGADRTGRYAIEELVKTRKDFVVIEKDQHRTRELMDQGILCVEGNATRDQVLLQAGIEQARGLISSLDTDAENLLVVITAKRLAPSVRVISKAIEDESEQKMRMVGADGVVMPNFIGGLRMASEMVRPSVVSLLDVMLREKDKAIRIEDVSCHQDRPSQARPLRRAALQTSRAQPSWRSRIKRSALIPSIPRGLPC